MIRVPAFLQDLVPVLTFLRRKMSLENLVCPSRRGSHARHGQTDYLHRERPASSASKAATISEPSGSLVMVARIKPGCWEFGLPPKLA
jgi:hypothetical protein